MFMRPLGRRFFPPGSR